MLTITGKDLPLTLNTLRIARKLSQRSTHAFAFHAAILLRGGAIVATGYNHDEIHAEENALCDLWPSKCRGTVLWSIRFTKTGRLANGKPCLRCETLARERGVKLVYYSTRERVERMRLT